MAEADKAERRGINFNSEINLGAPLQAGVVLCGLIAWAVTTFNRSEQAGHDLTTERDRFSLTR